VGDDWRSWRENLKGIKAGIPVCISLTWSRTLVVEKGIRFGRANRSHVMLTVFNTLGQSVATLPNGDQDAGYHEVRFDGANLPSGVYFYRMQAGSFTETRKLLLVR
jgi:hypothetical protein